MNLRVSACLAMFLLSASTVTLCGCDSAVARPNARRQSTPATMAAPVTKGCVWVWVGPETGWVLDYETCDGKCTTKPRADGKFPGDTAVTPCDLDGCCH